MKGVESIDDLQERLGHSTIGITLDIYSHVSPMLHDEAATRSPG